MPLANGIHSIYTQIFFGIFVLAVIAWIGIRRRRDVHGSGCFLMMKKDSVNDKSTFLSYWFWD
jgi:hypothetical protein